jgi:ABC-type transport system substrate-binding protein
VDSSGNPVRFELLTSVDDLQGRIASLIRQDLARVGIEVSVRQEELRSLVSRLTRSRDYDVVMMNMDVPLEPFQMGDLLLSDGARHIWRLDRSEAPPWELEIDRLMEEFSATIDQERRVELFSRVQRLLADEVPLIPLVHRDILLARSPGLSPIDVASVLPYAWARSWKISWATP